ncbi:hypothetical protein R6138_01882 [Ralstonia thomasii]|nr:hypothetical protein R6138_01882 [Ralstonia sp. LMG 18095]
MKYVLIAVMAVMLTACDTIPRKLGMTPVTEPIVRKPAVTSLEMAECQGSCYQGGAAR